MKLLVINNVFLVYKLVVPVERSQFYFGNDIKEKKNIGRIKT